LAWGTLLGGVLQFAVQVPALLRVAPGLRFSLRTRDAGTREVIRSFVPIVAGRGVVRLSGFLHLFLASFLALGALAALRYAQILYVLPVSLFGMAVAAAELPELSRIDADRQDVLRARVDSGLARIVFFVAPTMVAYVVAGDFVVAALYQSGEFGRSDVVQVWIILAVHALGLLATTGSRLLQSVLYGLGRPRTPARIALVRVAVSLVLGLVLMFQLDRLAIGPDGLERVGDLPALGPLPEQFRDPAGARGLRHLGGVGLAVAAATASVIEYRLLRRAVRPHTPDVTIVGGRLRWTLAAAAISGVAATAVRPVAAGLPPIVAGLVVTGVLGTVYPAAAWRLGVPEVRRIVQLLTRRPRTVADPGP
jgi:putative peptidoglycan lipid II flippase